MLTAPTAALRPSPHDATSTQGHADKASMPAADPAGFSSLLRQARLVPTPSASASAEPPSAVRETGSTNEEPAPDEAANEAPHKAPAEPESANRARATFKGRSRAAEGSNPVQREAKPASPAQLQAHAQDDLDDASATSTRARDADKAKATAAAEAPIDPSVMHWLAELQRAAADPAEAATTGGDGETVRVDSHRTAAGSRAADLKADAQAEAKAASGKAERADAAGADANSFAAVLAEKRAAETPAALRGESVTSTRETATPNANALAPTPLAGTDATALAAVAIASPIDAPDFARELGLSLSVLARDGVQHAELHLNPADMGPVSVQIVIDGTRAHVDFGADIAATRQAIEAGLPELASAMHDAGFTLAGGGVSQHAAGGRGGSGGEARDASNPGARRAIDVGRDSTAARGLRRAVSNGGVDLYA